MKFADGKRSGNDERPCEFDCAGRQPATVIAKACCKQRYSYTMAKASGIKLVYICATRLAILTSFGMVAYNCATAHMEHTKH